jgi:hypothetical protein
MAHRRTFAEAIRENRLLPPTSRSGVFAGQVGPAIAMSGRSYSYALRERRGLAALLIGASALAGLTTVLVMSVAPHARPEQSTAAASADPTLVDVDRLAANGLLGQIGTQPFESLRNDVLAQARHALQREPRPGPLPDAVGDLRDDGKAALGLATAFVLTGDSRYGRGAAKYVDAWATNATLDPACLETECDRAWRIGRDLPAFVFAEDMIRGSPSMTDQQADRFADWLVTLRPGAPRSDHFEGDADVLARVVISAYLDDPAMLDLAVSEWRARLALIEADGRLSPSASAESPVADTQETLTYRLLAARIAEDHGRTVLDATGSTGASVRSATERLAADWADPASWPGTSRPPAGPLWEIVYALWPDARYVPLLTEYRSGGGGSLVAMRWSTLFESRVTEAAAASTPPVAAGATSAPTVPSPSLTPTPVAASPPPSPTPRPGPTVETPMIGFLRGPVRANRARVRLSWPTARRAADDRSALSYRLESAMGDGEYRLVAQGARRQAELMVAPGSSHRYRLRASTPAVGPGSWSSALAVRMRRYEDSDPTIRTTAGWASASAPAYSDGYVRYSTKRGATMTIEVHGRAVAIRGPIGPTRGQVDVMVDGGPAIRIDLGAARFVGSVVVFTRAWESDGDHRIRLRVVGTAGRAVVAIDSIDVLDDPGGLVSPRPSAAPVIRDRTTIFAS